MEGWHSSLGHAMNRTELLEAISHLEYLVLNHPDPAKSAAYAQELQEFRERLRLLDEKRNRAAGSSTSAAK